MVDRSNPEFLISGDEEVQSSTGITYSLPVNSLLDNLHPDQAIMSILRTSTLLRNTRTLAALQPRIFTGARAIQTSVVWRNAASTETSDGQVDIRGKLKEALKAAMKGKEKEAVGCIRVRVCVIVMPYSLFRPIK